MLVSSWSRGVAVLVLCLSGCGGASPEAEWTQCLGGQQTAIASYRTLLDAATTKVAELPAPSSAAQAIADRKVINDALVMVGAEIATLEAVLKNARTTVEPTLHGPEAAATVQTGCAALAAAAKQVTEKINTTGTAIKIYNDIIAKTRWAP